jgi:hypothetical protein
MQHTRRIVPRKNNEERASRQLKTAKGGLEMKCILLRYVAITPFARREIQFEVQEACRRDRIRLRHLGRHEESDAPAKRKDKVINVTYIHVLKSYYLGTTSSKHIPARPSRCAAEMRG